MSIIALKPPYTLILQNDYDAESPRTDECFGKMICFHNRYSLGDEHDYSYPSDFIRELIRNECLPANEMINYIKSGQSDNVKLEFDRFSHQWDISYYDNHFKKWSVECSFDPPLDGQESDVADAIVETMTMSELINIAKNNCCILPLYLYDHSGITMSTSRFNDPWDSGQVGWIYVSHTDVEKEYGTFNEESIEKAMKLLQGEVEYYDHYIRGDCYGFQLYKDDEEIDSCWGFIGSPDEMRSDVEGYLPEGAKGIMNNLTYRYDDPDIDEVLREQEYGLEVG